MRRLSISFDKCTASLHKIKKKIEDNVFIVHFIYFDKLLHTSTKKIKRYKNLYTNLYSPSRYEKNYRNYYIFKMIILFYKKDQNFRLKVFRT